MEVGPQLADGGIIVVRPLVHVDARTASGTAAALEPRQLLDERLRAVASRLRRMVTEIRVRTDLPAHSFAAELTEIAELAER